MAVIALTREVSPAIGRCELTHAPRVPIDAARARAQHRAYEDALMACGCAVRRLPAGDDMPDAVFIEDTAVVLPEVAIICRPGAESRRGEVAAVSDALGALRPLAVIREPGTLDGGDVLFAGGFVFVGRSSRTNEAGIEQLSAAIAHHGYEVIVVPATRCLHLKSAATALNDRTVLLNPDWVSRDCFDQFDCIEVDPSEPAAANVVSINGRLICADAYPRTRDRLAAGGFEIVTVDASELAKAEGALTCCSLIVGDR
jgi:dimethylargininase